MKAGIPVLWNCCYQQLSYYLFLLLLGGSVILFSPSAQSQCASGFNQATLNWDNLDYYFNSSGNGPYINYINDTREQTQKFAIGRTWLSIVTSSNGLVNPGAGNSAENATHTGDVPNFTGEDVQYDPSADGQTITITFNEEVQNTSFTLYDIDGNARIDIDAYNTANVARNVGITTYAGSILTVTNNNNTNTFITASTGTNLANNLNTGTATATITSAINRIVITVTARGSNPVFWLSDIHSCVPGSFPLNYHQGAGGQPFTGPAGNQPSYFLATPDNDAVYMIDPATGNARFLFQDASRDYVNSFAYDPYNHILYYISENSAVDQNNKTLKKYDFNTNTSSVLIADISATLGIPTFDMGIESAGAAFYDGALYLGIEGGRYNVSGTSNDRTRESIVWRIDFDGSLNPVNAYQVFASNAYTSPNPSTSVHDWGDFLIKDGILYNFNTARNGTCGTCYGESKYHHYDMMTGQVTVFNNPSNTQFSGQGGLTWEGDLYWMRDSVGRYNGDGTIDQINARRITVIPGSGPYPTWVGGTGDASDPFRPKSDFGDAPASFDPDPQSPATHEIDSNLRIGANIIDEWTPTSSALADAEPASEEDGIGAAPALNFDGTLTYTVNNISVFNNTGSDAILGGWLDYNFDGVFDAGEGVTITVPSSASAQLVNLSWNNITVFSTALTHTFLRLRITSAANGMTAANMNGWYSNGEVEDYPVLIGVSLPKDLTSFSVQKSGKDAVAVKWGVNIQQSVAGFEILRSVDNTVWKKIGVITPNSGFGIQNYTFTDTDPQTGTSYYRIRINYQATGTHRFTEVRSVRIDHLRELLRILPNPVTGKQVRLEVTAANKGNAVIRIFDNTGRTLINLNREVEAGLNIISLDNLSALLPGSYTLQLVLNGRATNKAFIISKQ